MWKKIPWQDVCKFLAGAYFEQAGILIYFYTYRISVPIFRTGYIETPEISGLRSIVHTILFVTFFYLGFLRNWKNRSAS